MGAETGGLLRLTTHPLSPGSMRDPGSVCSNVTEDRVPNSLPWPPHTRHVHGLTHIGKKRKPRMVHILECPKLKTLTLSSVGGDGGNWHAHGLQGRSVKWHSHFGKEVGHLRSHLRCGPVILLEINQRPESTDHYKDWSVTIQRSFTCKSPQTRNFPHIHPWENG